MGGKRGFVAFAPLGQGRKIRRVRFHQQTIQRDFRHDPLDWTGNRNQDGGLGTNYGFSNSSNAGGDPGEAGGTIPGRTNVITSYADTTIADFYPVAQQDGLFASGRFTATAATTNGGLELGWFDAGPTSGDPDFLGMRLVDGGGTLRWQARSIIDGALDASGWGSSNLVVGTDYLFTMSFDPDAEGAGNGALAVEFRHASDGSLLDRVYAVGIDSGDVHPVANLNAFGLKTLDLGVNNFNNSVVYIDDLLYTASIPEPTSLALMGLAGVLLAGFGRRRRK